MQNIYLVHILYFKYFQLHPIYHLQDPAVPKRTRRPTLSPGTGGHSVIDDDYSVEGVVTEPYDDPNDPNNDPPGISFGDHQPSR